MKQPESPLPSSETAKTPTPALDSPERTLSESPEKEEENRNKSKLPAEPFHSTIPHTAHQSMMHSHPQVQGYRLIRKLGSGTYGVVWLAEEENTSVKVAIKFLTATLGQQWEQLQEEVKQLAMLDDDPGIVQLKEFDPHATPPYYIMAFIEGGSLAERLKKGPLAVAEAAKMFRRIAEALAYVHAKGIRHCDLKPGNILLDMRDRPRVADFGQAHLSTDASPALGTFFYMAPEQADLQPQIPDAGWDVYGLGAIFYAMVTGGPPYEDSTLKLELAKTERLSQRLLLYREAMQRAKPLTAHRYVEGMDRPLADILERCLAVDPARRFRTAEAVLAALDRRHRTRRQRAILFGGLVVPILLLLILGGLCFWGAERALGTTGDDLEVQAKKNYSLSARLVADRVKSKMEYLLPQLNKAADSEELKTALRDREKNPANLEAWEKSIQSLLKKFRKEAYPSEPNPVTGYSLFDSRGTLIDMYSVNGPEERQRLLGQNFAWRDYFNGHGDDQPQGGGANPKNLKSEQYGRIERAHISQPYKTRDPNQPWVVSLSTPVRSLQDESGQIFVLAANLDLNALNGWLEDKFSDGDGFSVVIDSRYHILLHDRKRDLPQDSLDAKTYPDCPLYKEIFHHHGAGVGDLPADPINGEYFLVGYMPIAFEDPANPRQTIDVRWAVLIQVKRDDVRKPADNLRNQMIRWGAMMLAVALFLILGLWLGLVWLLRREERLAYG